MKHKSPFLGWRRRPSFYFVVGLLMISGASPSLKATQQVEPVHFSANSGVYRQPFNLVLSTPTSGATIWYTTDFSEPSPGNGTVYNGPIPIGDTRVIRAAAFHSDLPQSPVVSHTYLFHIDPSLQTLPIMSLVISPGDLWGPSGIMGIGGGEYIPIDSQFSSWQPVNSGDYFNPAKLGPDWERPCSIEVLPGPGEKGFLLRAGIRVHGSDSSRLTYHTDSKVSYNIFFRDSYEKGFLDYPLMPNSPVRTFDSLVLRAGHNDPVNPFITDELMRRLQADAGEVSSHGTFVSLFINGQYAGYYNPTERIDEDWARLWHGGGNSWDIVQPYDVAQQGDTAAWDDLIQFVKSHDLGNNNNYQEVANRVDLVNFVDYLLVNIYGSTRDWTVNNFRVSRERTSEGKFRFYIWDAEFALGLYGLPVDNNVFNDSEALGNSSEIAILFKKLKNNREFKFLFADRAQKLFYNHGALTDENVLNRFEELRQNLSGVLPGMDRTIPDVWVPQRRAYVLQDLDNKGLLRPTPAPVFNQDGGSVPRGFGLTMDAPAGQIYFTLDGSDPRVPFSQNIAAAAEAFYPGSEVTLTDSVVVKARAKDGGSWSALTEAEFHVAKAAPPIRITEVMYNPPGGNAYEFLEVANEGAVSVDLEGIAIDGVNYTFPRGAVLGPWAALVLGSADDPAGFAGRYGFQPFDYFSGKLSNGGETLSLIDRGGQTFYAVTYNNNGGGWPGSADGGGSSLEILDPEGDPNDPANWRASSNQGGSPGTVTRKGQPLVQINEVMAQNFSAVKNGAFYPDWLELYNPGSTGVDLSGWRLSDDSNPTKYIFPAGTSISGGGYLVVWCDSQWDDPGLHTGFALSQHGESLFLYDSTGYRVDAVGFGPQIQDESVGLVSGKWILNTPTPGAANQAAQTGSVYQLIVNEWMANSRPGSSDWIELYNRDANKPVPLQGLYFTRSNVVFQIRSPGFVAPHGFLQLWADENAGADHLGLKLSATGGTIGLLSSAFDLIDQVDYGAQTEGVSEGRMPDGALNAQSFPNNATPGAPNAPATYNGVRINEFMARNATAVSDSAGRHPDWVELYNPTDSPQDVGGMRLNTANKATGQWVIPASVTIAPRGYLVVWFAGDRAASTESEAELNAGQSLDGDGGGVYFFDRAGLLVDMVEYGAQAPDLSVGLNNGNWKMLAAATPGGDNGPPATLGSVSGVRINEWMADPGIGDDWFELYNRDSQPVDLSGFFLTDDPSTYGESKFKIHPLTFLGPHGWAEWLADGSFEKGPNHVNFSLDKMGETLRLYAPDFSIVDSVDLAPQSLDVSQGRLPDGADDLASFPTTASPGELNHLPGADADQDGLPDSWEVAHGLNPNDPADATQDADGDGLTNLQEYRIGTDPRDATSDLKLVVCVENGNIQVRFQAVANQSYSVLYRQLGAEGAWSKLQDIPAQPTTRTVILTDPFQTNVPSRFFRIVSPASQ